jgi:hypothetical protein
LTRGSSSYLGSSRRSTTPGVSNANPNLGRRLRQGRRFHHPRLERREHAGALWVVDHPRERHANVARLCLGLHRRRQQRPPTTLRRHERRPPCQPGDGSGRPRPRPTCERRPGCSGPVFDIFKASGLVGLRSGGDPVRQAVEITSSGGMARFWGRYRRHPTKITTSTDPESNRRATSRFRCGVLIRARADRRS